MRPNIVMLYLMKVFTILLFGLNLPHKAAAMKPVTNSNKWFQAWLPLL